MPCFNPLTESFPRKRDSLLAEIGCVGCAQSRALPGPSTMPYSISANGDSRLRGNGPVVE